MSEDIELPEDYPTQVSNLANTDVETVNAELVRMMQSSAGAIQAEDVEVNHSLVLQAQTLNLTVRHSALAALHADEVDMRESGAGIIRANAVTLNGGAGIIAANSADLGNTYAGAVIGREVRGEKIETLVLLARRVEGNVSTVIDARGALLAGLVGGMFAGIMLLLGRMLFGRK